MPLFAQRRLSSMLTELSRHLTDNKFNELSNGLVHEKARTALAAESELAVTWAISKVAHIVSEPVLPHSNRRPEAYSEDLFGSGPAVLEVRALSDDSFSGKDAMERTANIIAGYADQLRRKAGKQLCFEFMERNYWSRRYHRERCVDPQFQLTEAIKQEIRQWISSPQSPTGSIDLRIANDKTDVVIKRVDPRSGRPRIFCTMPPVAYDLEDNPVYKALKAKSRQVRGTAKDTLRCVFLVDTGCYLLRRLRTRVSAVHEVRGETIIRHALSKLSIDVIIVLSPHREQLGLGFLGPSRLVWQVSYFDRRDTAPSNEYHRIDELAALLPPPRFEGYQARSLHEKGSFARERNRWYLPTTTLVERKTMTIKLSAGLLHEYLAGQLDADRFRQRAFNDRNFFELELARGNSIREVRFEPGGLDEDDDYVVLELYADQQVIAKK